MTAPTDPTLNKIRQGDPWPIERALDPTYDANLCPACDADTFAPLSDGRRLCLACRHEWDPSNPHAPGIAVPTVDTDGSGSAHAKPLPDPEVLDLETQLAAARALYVGREAVVHELEQTGTVTEVDDEGLAHVEFGSGYFVLCEPDEFSLVDTPDVPDEVVAQVAATDLAVVAQVLRAGMATIDDQDEAINLGFPPDGWLPQDPDIMPVIEHGAAYAIAWLAVQYGVTKDQLASAAQAFEDAAKAAGEAIGQ